LFGLLYANIMNRFTFITFNLQKAKKFVYYRMRRSNYTLNSLLVDHLTHINYAFADIGPNGEVYLSDSYTDQDKLYPADAVNYSAADLHGNLKQLFWPKQNRNLKTLLSIGGWTFSSHFKEPAASVDGRDAFATSAACLVKDYGFDGKINVVDLGQQLIF
jgi:chitinase